MNNRENEVATRQRIIKKVRTKSSAFKVNFLKAHPLTGNLHPNYPDGLFIQLQFASPYRYSNAPSHLFQSEEELDRFLSTFM